MSNPQQTVEKTQLEALLMTARPLIDLQVDQKEWTTISSDLKKEFPKDRYGVVDVCVAYYAYKKDRLIKWQVDKQHEGLATRVVDFLDQFMKANGQWAYIENQSWFMRRQFAIGIDVNYYPDRSEAKLSPDFHKDTGGNNIFVNLIFDNKNPIESTEWFVDLADPSGARAAWQEKLLPEDHLTELKTLRQKLHDKQKDEVPVVKGGVLTGENIYVSWVDDLVWHATPCVNTRIEYNAAAAEAGYDELNQSNSFSYRDSTFGGAEILGVELLGTMAENQNTALAEWLKTANKKVQDIDYELASAAWYKLYVGDRGKDTFVADAKKRATEPWRLTGRVSEANAQDKRLEGSQAITETPVGLSKIRRANSVDSKELKEVAAANKNVPRSFIRTWIRILPAGSSELTDAGFIIQ